jgi:chemotaxis regulatin CheY-phosphate phosphatase CheZ
MVSILMAFDMQSWKEADVYSRLGNIARKMDNIERRLDLARGGPKTQKMEKDAIARLDEIIKELENQAKGDCNGGA